MKIMLTHEKGSLVFAFTELMLLNNPMSLFLETVKAEGCVLFNKWEIGDVLALGNGHYLIAAIRVIEAKYKLNLCPVPPSVLTALGIVCTIQLKLKSTSETISNHRNLEKQKRLPSFPFTALVQVFDEQKKSV
ncbi:hypothetical protein NDU88_002103 [Pleurodeles waltl]|uniref:Uncharacterized protein n=1 Tax=Pleurodeles waltl TaxID=8319 RepID=A0AAV7NCP4_PLEWA|nr:hypothetical protein NDU88_002103 [Pleurodeles waltl]